MRVEIIQGGRVLRQFNHEGQSFIEAPPSGDYSIRLTNNCPRRRIAVISVDGINVVDGSPASHDGPGYVIRPWETVPIKGWRRTDSEVAAFTFTEQGGSYSNQAGKGTKNVGVIGVAVFEEKERPPVPAPFVIHTHHHHHHPAPPPCYPPPQYTWQTTSTGTAPQTFGSPVSTTTTTTADSRGIPSGDDDAYLGDDGGEVACCAGAAAAACSDDLDYSHVVEQVTTTTRRRLSKSRGLVGEGTLRREVGEGTLRREVKEVGTGYGGRATMHTEATEFERATAAPVLVVVLRYAVRAKLEEWGVPMGVPASPEAFPASAGVAVAAPPGWRG